MPDEDSEFVDEPCEHCGETENVSECPNGENLCPDCGDEAWF